MEQHPVPSDLLRVLWWPTVAAGLFGIAVLRTPSPTVSTILTHGALVLVVVLHARRRHLPWQMAGLLTALGGATAAFIVAVALFLSNPHIVTFFNLFTQPGATALLDGIVGGALLAIFPRQEQGEHHHAHHTPSQENPSA